MIPTITALAAARETKAMRIAVVTSSFPSHDEDPSGHFVHAEVRELIEAGHEVTVLCPRRARAALDSLTERRATLCELPHLDLFGWPGALTRIRDRPWRAIGLFPFVASARVQLRKLGPFDRIVAHWLVPAFWPICRDFGARTEVVAHGSDVRLLERLPRFARRPIVTALSRTHVSLRCVSNELAERVGDLARDHGSPLPPIVVRAATIAMPRMAPKADLRRELGWTTAPNIVIVGRAVATKRIDVAIEVVHAANAIVARKAGACGDRGSPQADSDAGPAPLLRRRPPLASLHVIGDGPARESWMQKYPEVHWLGRLGRGETLKYIAAADVVVSASELEGAPTVIREARALGTEVLAARAGDLAAAALGDPGLHVTADFAPRGDSEAVRLLAALLERHGDENGRADQTGPAGRASNTAAEQVV